MSIYGAKIHNSHIKKNLDEAISQFESAKSLLSLETIYEPEKHSNNTEQPWLEIRASRVSI